jgi:predicted ferric reductase
VKISFCGPKGLLKTIRAHMREHRIPVANLHHEYFEFR